MGNSDSFAWYGDNNCLLVKVSLITISFLRYAQFLNNNNYQPLLWFVFNIFAAK